MDNSPGVSWLRGCFFIGPGGLPPLRAFRAPCRGEVGGGSSPRSQGIPGGEEGDAARGHKQIFHPSQKAATSPIAFRRPVVSCVALVHVSNSATSHPQTIRYSVHI
jgi:hypothetical protein